MSIRAIKWENNALHLLDQRLLPNQEVWIRYESWSEVRDAIKDMVVRGAPAIGVTAAYAMALASQKSEDLPTAHKGLASSRPTAVNLFWALDRISRLTDLSFESILTEAKKIEAEDLAMNHAIGNFGADLVPNNAQILTICNTGSLATAGHGTALGIIRTAYQQGKVSHVYSCETRPRQQGLRLTAWELLQDKIPFHSIPDSAAASLMLANKVDFVVAGADRIAANGDSANKIGTYMLAVLAKHHNIPFVIAAPSSTIDNQIENGTQIPIEERDATELTQADGVQIGPLDCPVYNPGFDVTPAELISAIVTENGVHKPPFQF